MRINTIILLTCLFTISYNMSAQIVFKTEYIGTSAYRMTEGDKDEKVGNSKVSAIVYQGGINIPLSMKLDDNNHPTMWSIGLGGAYVSLNNKNFTEQLVVDKIMNLGLNLNHLRPLNNKWSILVSIGGGLYTDDIRFSKIRLKHVLGNIGTVFIYHLRDNLQLGGGLALNNSFGFPMVFPAFYLNWTTKGKFAAKVSLLEGMSAAIGYDMNKSLRLNFASEMNGQMALVEKDEKDKIFAHQYIIVGFRPEIKINKYCTIPITVGINAMRTAEFYNKSLKSFFSDNGYYFQVSPYISAGINIHF